MATAHKAQRIKKQFAGGITRDDAARVTRLGANKRRQVLCSCGGAQHQLKRVKIGALKLIKDACGEDAALTAAFADQGNFFGFKWGERQGLKGVQ